MMIQDAMKKKNMSVYKLSKTSTVPYATCNDIVNGKARLEKCSVETVYKIAQALNISMESLLAPYFVKRSSFENFKSTKTEASRRDIALAMSVLRYIPEGQPDHYFIVGGEKTMSYTEVRNMCNHIRKDIGYTGTISPLRFRTTVLTDIYAATKDIKKTQEAAGHTTATMTLKHYVKSRNCAEENTAAVVESMYGVSE